MKIIQKQATVDEARAFLRDGKWPWSAPVMHLYRQAIERNSYISVNPGTSLRDAQTVYNENAMKQLLSWNTKEGDFLLTGVVIGHPDGMPKNINNVVRCFAEGDEAYMKKTVYNGYNGINGALSYYSSRVPDAEIPAVVPGFSFLAEKGVCNPCAPLNATPDYSCPFIIDTGNGTEISDIWTYLWGLNKGDGKGGWEWQMEKRREREFVGMNNSYLLGVSRVGERRGNAPRVWNESANV